MCFYSDSEYLSFKGGIAPESPKTGLYHSTLIIAACPGCVTVIAIDKTSHYCRLSKLGLILQTIVTTVRSCLEWKAGSVSVYLILWLLCCHRCGTAGYFCWELSSLERSQFPLVIEDYRETCFASELLQRYSCSVLNEVVHTRLPWVARLRPVLYGTFSSDYFVQKSAEGLVVWPVMLWL